MLHQHTIGGEVHLAGQGIHTGTHSRLTLMPAAVDRGRVFINSDGVEILADVDNVVACDRSTVLGVGESRVHTPEHLLSALFAFEIDNVEIHLEGEEIPILDGSAKPFWEAIRTVGRREQDAAAKVVAPKEPLAVGTVDGPMVLVLPSEETIFEAILYYPHKMLGHQEFCYEHSEIDYGEQIAPARTFALWEEVQPLLERGMAKGGSLENALIVHPDRFSSELRLPQEPVRHKCLDLIGDFALLNARLKARVIAVKAGHRWHVEAAKKVREESKVS